MFGSRRILQPQLRKFLSPSQNSSRLGFRPSRNASSVASENTSSWPSLRPRRLIYAGIFGSLGFGAGQWMDRKIGAPPLPGTEEDASEMRAIRYVFDNSLPVVVELRRNPDYVESEVYENYSEEDKAHRLSSGPLRGSRGLALQRVFWNEKEKKAVSVIFFGPGLEGWPTIVHGGALATVIDENMGRAALRTFPERTGVTANLQINYRAPAFSGHFFSLHTTIDHERSTDRKAYVMTQVRDPAGTVCAEATGLFVVPKKLKLPKIDDRY